MERTCIAPDFQLSVTILSASDLPAMDRNGMSDPYVKIYVLPDRKQKYETRIIRNTLNPTYNETFQFSVSFCVVLCVFVKFAESFKFQVFSGK